MTSTSEAQKWDPDHYKKNASFVAEYGRDLLELLAPQRGERILDLGCGDGVLTKQLHDMGCDVTGVDLSANQVEAACSLGLDARVMSGESLQFKNEFDAILSNAALHWMKKPDAVLAGAYSALKKEGRFVAEMGGAGNVSKICAALKLAMEKRGLDFDSAYPWYFPTVEDYQEKLIAAGFRVESIKLFARPTPLPGDIAGWLSTFAGSFLSALEQSQWSDLIDEVRDILSPDLKQEDGLWYADYMRLRFVAIKS